MNPSSCFLILLIDYFDAPQAEPGFSSGFAAPQALPQAEAGFSSGFAALQAELGSFSGFAAPQALPQAEAGFSSGFAAPQAELGFSSGFAAPQALPPSNAAFSSIILLHPNKFFNAIIIILSAAVFCNIYRVQPYYTRGL
jgi:hypothetical protein|nr:hypothetical protein [Dialister sp.]